MILYNYSGLKDRDTKIYNIGGYNIAGGFSVNFLMVTGPVALTILILGRLIAIPFGIPFLSKYTLIWFIVGAVIGYGLYKIEVFGYRLYEYLIAYFKPKKVYTNDFKITEYKHTNISIKTFIKSIL
ncbi:MAG: hypothetical protein VZS44_10740 [Bacilli bacterium]|nr:hypothetical protein [Bacilli bacterium]